MAILNGADIDEDQVWVGSKGSLVFKACSLGGLIQLKENFLLGYFGEVEPLRVIRLADLQKDVL